MQQLFLYNSAAVSQLSLDATFFEKAQRAQDSIEQSQLVSTETPDCLCLPSLRILPLCIRAFMSKPFMCFTTYFDFYL